jgi:hypothetical protein
MSPALYLIVLLGLLIAAITIDLIRWYSYSNKLRVCAHGWHMHFAHGDRLRIARRIVHQFPVPGAALIRVRDLIFRTDETRHVYLFTVDFTVGVIRGKVGRSRVAGFSEPVARGHQAEPHPSALIVAPREMSGPAAYQYVMKQMEGKGNGGMMKDEFKSD